MAAKTELPVLRNMEALAITVILLVRHKQLMVLIAVTGSLMVLNSVMMAIKSRVMAAAILARLRFLKKALFPVSVFMIATKTTPGMAGESMSLRRTVGKYFLMKIPIAVMIGVKSLFSQGDFLHFCLWVNFLLLN